MMNLSWRDDIFQAREHVKIMKETKLSLEHEVIMQVSILFAYALLK